MTKQDLLQIIKLLSALESWGTINNQRLPEYLFDDIGRVMEKLEEEVLK